jgi:ubiquinone/menaquinone biosynthesis C-methylase UbiE
MAEALSDAWEGDRVARWVKQSEVLEAQLAPVGDELFAAAQLAPGETVLDVGCGTGPTTRRAAAAVGAGGAVTGLDIAAEMLEAAAKAPVAQGAAPIEWLQVDAVEWSPPSSKFDVVLSRFGVMFFSEPVRAFANLAAATRPGGRLAITTWARRDESELFAVPLAATLAALDRDAGELPDDQGPFSMPDADTIAGVLEPAGWGEIRTEIRRLDLPFGGRLDPAAAAAVALDFGPTRIVTADLDDASRHRVGAAIAEALASHVDDQGHVVLGGTVLIVTAKPRR